MNSGIKIAVPPNTRLLRIAREPAKWIVWLYASQDFSYGTLLECGDDGSCWRVTIEPDGSERRFLVKPKDGEVG